MEKMKSWPRYPVIYEINTWVWLNELRAKSQEPRTKGKGQGARGKNQRPLSLANVPGEEWDRIASLGFDVYG